MRTNDYTCNHTIKRVLRLRKDAGLLDPITLVSFLTALGIKARATERQAQLISKLRAVLDNWVVRLNDLVLPDTALRDVLYQFETYYTHNDIWAQTHAR